VKSVIYLAVADAELVQSAQYYDAQREGLGRLFLDAVRETESRIRRNPRLWALRVRPVRSCRVKRFPFRLLYAEESERVVVLAVMPLSRHPGYRLARLA